MTWYLELGSKAGVLQFSRYLNDTAGLELKKVMAQLLRIRQIQLKNDAIPGTWQGKTPEARIAEILCSFGHDRMVILPDGTSQAAAVGDFERDIRAALGRWYTTVVAKTVRETESDPAAPGDARDPQYFALAAVKLANNPNIRALGPLTANTSIDMIMKLMGGECDLYDEILDNLWEDCKRHAAQLAARAYEEKNAELDATKLSATAMKAISKIRGHQKMKLDGSAFISVKGAHEDGKFWMLNRCIDGMPILLVSSDATKDVKDDFIGEAMSMASASDSSFCNGTFTQNRKANEIRFHIQSGQTQTPMFLSALNAMNVRRASVLSAPAANAWAAATRK
jgi:hypothetical protein